MLKREVKIINPSKVDEDKKIRVGIYCRVSTDKSDQLNSFFAQMRYYNDFVRANDKMTLIDIYADEGITGTSMQKRDEFKRLVKDCKHKKLDRVIVKSVTRFARNSLECIEVVRELKTNGVTVLFENDNIDTADMSSEMILYIKSAFAQGESMTASKRMATSIRNRMQDGTYKNSRAPLGYDLVNSELVLNKMEAEIVKEIFAMYLKGVGSTSIAKILNEKYYDGENVFIVPKVTYILENERYIGDSMWQKNYTPQQFPFRCVKNRGQVDKYYCEGTHESIISKEDFEKVRELRQKRVAKHYKSVKGKQTILRGKIYCRQCERVYKIKTCASEETYLCSNQGLSVDVCHAKAFKATEVLECFRKLYNKLKYNEKLILNDTIVSLQNLKVKVANGMSEIGDIDAEISSLTNQNKTYADLYAMNAVDEIIYFEKTDKIKMEITELRSRRLKLINSDEDEQTIEKLKELKKLLSSGVRYMRDVDERLFVKMVEKIYVNEDDSLSFILKGGLELKMVI